MTIFYSPSMAGFYDDAIHDSIPEDAIEITPEAHAGLLEAQSTGKVIRPDATGNPIAVAPPPPGADVLEQMGRSKRDALLSASDWTQLADAPLSASAKTAWANYRQALRAVPQQSGYPEFIAWPTSP